MTSAMIKTLAQIARESLSGDADHALFDSDPSNAAEYAYFWAMREGRIYVEYRPESEQQIKAVRKAMGTTP